MVETVMKPLWMIELNKIKNKEYFSEISHSYFKLAAMRVMQQIREKHKVPPEDLQKLMIAIWARLFNEVCYAIGGAIKRGVKLQEIFSKEQLLNLLKVLSNEGLDPLDRKDINVELEKSLDNFKKFILENANDFYI